MNLRPGQYVIRWGAEKLPAIDVHPLIVGQLIKPMAELPGRWQVSAEGGFELWHRTTILRTLKDANEGAAILSAQLAVIKFAWLIAGKTPCGEGPPSLWRWVDEFLTMLAKEGLKR